MPGDVVKETMKKRIWRPAKHEKTLFEAYWYGYNLGKDAAFNTLKKKEEKYRKDFTKGYDDGFEKGRLLGVEVGKKNYLCNFWLYIKDKFFS